MTNSVNYQNQAIPAYSGITINITNPTVNPPSAGHVCQPGCTIHNQNLANNNDGNMYTTNPTQPINPYMTQYGTLSCFSNSTSVDFKSCTINVSISLFDKLPLTNNQSE